MKIPMCIVVGLMLTAPAARADDTGADKVVLYGGLGIAAGLFDIVATVADIRSLAAGEPPSKQFGQLETLIAVPQMGVSAYLFESFVSRPPSIEGATAVTALTAVWFAWASALAVHGIWTWLRPDEPAPSIAIGLRPTDAAPTGPAALLWSVSGRF